MGWFNGVSVAPAWFNQWHQSYLQSLNSASTSDVSEHAEQFSRAIVNGQKVLVVAHSGGNYYVNEAKRSMQQTLPSGKMQSFSVFGVGVPTDNVAGNTGPYVTNHKDYIQTVAGALPSNWTLKSSGGAVVQDIDGVLAHSFNETYMSTNFDVRAALIAGIQDKLGQTVQPTRDCSVYRQAILSMVKGTYQTCSGPSTITPVRATDNTGVNGASDFEVDLTLSGDGLSLSSSSSGVSLSAVSRSFLISYEWEGSSRVFKKPVKYCSANDSLVAQTSLPTPVEITRTMLGAMEKKINYFYGTCSVKGSDGVTKSLPGLTPVVVSGSTIQIANSSWDLGSNWTSERVFDPVTASSTNKDPGFKLLNSDSASRIFSLEYRSTSGLRSVSLLDPAQSALVFSCSLR
jgi:FlaG/FlaF family flagellin (archaellin)